jgi:hypothetical protein
MVSITRQPTKNEGCSEEDINKEMERELGKLEEHR